MLFCIWVRIHRSKNGLIQFYQVGVFYCSQAYQKYYDLMGYSNTKESKRIKFILWFLDKHSQ